MKVIFLPNNTSSLVSMHIPALRKQGIEAVGYNFAPLKISDVDFVNTWPQTGQYLKIKRIIFLFKFMSDLLSSDVIHWMYAGNSKLTILALSFIRFLNKKKFVELSGTDIRSLEKMCEDISFYKYNDFSESLKTLLGTAQTSLETHLRFSKAGFHPLPSYPELIDYIDPKFFPKFDLISRSVNFSKLIPKNTQNSKPLIVHAPSNPEVKGTKYVTEAAERLVQEGLADYRLISGMTHTDALELLKSADIVVDQLVIGEYGVLAIEAMALRKAVVCFIRPKIERFYSENFDGFPIVNANIGNIYEVLKDLCLNNEKRNLVSESAYIYAIRYHNPDNIAKNLKSIYSRN